LKAHFIPGRKSTEDSEPNYNQLTFGRKSPGKTKVQGVLEGISQSSSS
jgi:hypothetical protein